MGTETLVSQLPTWYTLYVHRPAEQCASDSSFKLALRVPLRARTHQLFPLSCPPSIPRSRPSVPINCGETEWQGKSSSCPSHWLSHSHWAHVTHMVSPPILLLLCRTRGSCIDCTTLGQPVSPAEWQGNKWLCACNFSPELPSLPCAPTWQSPTSMHVQSRLEDG